MSRTLIGVIIGGSIAFTSGFIIEIFKQKKEKIKFKREKIEKLYFEYLNWAKAMRNLYSLFLHYLQTGKDIQSSLKLLADYEDRNKFIKDSNENNVIFLTNLYFPDLTISFQETKDLNGKLASAIMIHNIEKFNIDEFKNIYSSFLINIENLEKKILIVSNRIGKC